MRIRITAEFWCKVYRDTTLKEWRYLDTLEITTGSGGYRNTRRVRKILRAAGIGWEQA